jgi:D-alanyl-D-alanine carboxypeptidase
MTARGVVGSAGAAIAGTLLGAVLVLSTGSSSMPALDDNPPSPSGRRAEADPVGPAALLAWAVGGMPARSERALERMHEVVHATPVLAGLDWMRASRGPNGALIDDPAGELAIPIEAAVIRPREYARMVPPAERDLILSLRPGRALLAETAAGLRGFGAGLTMDLGSREVMVTGVVSDVAANGYEMLLPAPVPPSWARADRFLLALTRDCSPTRIREELRFGRALRIRCGRQQPFLRYGDSVLPQMLIKQSFGEFAARPLPDGTIAVERSWARRNIVTATVPLLPPVTCHRALLPQLRGALRELISRGLGHTVDGAQFAGCYTPRFIDRDPDGRLSHHSWGIAVDLNAGENTFGGDSRQDDELVEVMTSWGFTWGGGWLVPDPMHFEWLRWP